MSFFLDFVKSIFSQEEINDIVILETFSGNNVVSGSSLSSSYYDVCVICLCPIDISLWSCKKCNGVCCENCFVQYLNYKINTKEYYTIVCPNYECNEKIDNYEIEGYTGKDLEEIISLKEKEEENSRPVCKIFGCDKKLVLKSNKKYRKNYIYRCPDHTYYSICFCCSDRIKNNTGIFRLFLKPHKCDTKVAKLLRKNIKKRISKPCPRCNYLIEKVDGCPHMFCTNCKTNFCWKCRQFKRGDELNTEHKCRCNSF